MVEIVEAREASEDEVAQVHSRYYIDAIRRLCAAGGEYLPSMESNIGPDSWHAARRAAGAGLTLADGVMSGRWQIGFAPTRPPGHHATYERPKGFCIFGNIAITAKYIQLKYNVKRLAIIDFDVHHGNGTQEAFWQDPSVLYCSIHRENHYPYESGNVEDIGAGPGRGFTVNAPLLAGSDDKALFEAFDNQIKPRVEDFSPQIILVSAGFDGHIRDQIGGMRYTGAGYAGLADRILALARQSAAGRIITLLEGGYDIDGLREGVLRYLGRLIEA
jgi:acetoin utilization deacetylase AcuC-like enzyme